MVHWRASSFAVVKAEFLVQQKIMMGFWFACIPMTSGSLRCIRQQDNCISRNRDQRN